MILMSITMFTLGVLALLDTIYNYGDVFRVCFSLLLIGISVLLLAKAKNFPFFEKPNMTASTNNDSIMRTDNRPDSHSFKERKSETVNR